MYHRVQRSTSQTAIINHKPKTRISWFLGGGVTREPKAVRNNRVRREEIRYGKVRASTRLDQGNRRRKTAIRRIATRDKRAKTTILVGDF
jgi:hypothetical protein